ncbi:MAG: NAD(P)-dependent oxidoreductase [Actinomycetota bacterium]|nr:NAD(P)-dependent oxidoreductase [Actinomycetota bacterium]
MGDERFLVTGAGGCIGAWAVRLLLDEGVEVVASDVREDLRRLELVSHPGGLPDVDFVALDVTSTEAVARVVAERGVNRVVHLAGLQVPFCAANPPLGAAVNVVGTVNVFEAVRAAGPGVGLAYASSAAVFGSSSFASSGMVGDTSPALPDSHYGVYKVANEGTAQMYAFHHGVGSVGLRPFVIYGPGRDQGMTSEPTTAMLAAAAGVPYRMKFGGNVLLTHAADCAAAFIASARAAVGSGDAVCCNVPGRRIGVAALVSLIEEIVPEAAGLVTFETSPVKVAALLESPTLGAVIGEVPNRSLREGVESTIAHFRGALTAGLLEPPRG